VTNSRRVRNATILATPPRHGHYALRLEGTRVPDLTALNPGKTDVAEVLTYGREQLSRRTMQFGFIAAVVGGLSVFLGNGHEMLMYVGWGLIVFGVGYIAWEFGKTTQPQKPLLVLSPEGINMRVEGATEFFIPWQEVQGVDAITIRGPRGATFKNVTVVRVSRALYDKVIHVDSFLRRGPGWDFTFIPEGDTVQVALHHCILPVQPDELRAAVEARWHAFGGAMASGAASPQ
jgi:hypothetical protein